MYYESYIVCYFRLPKNTKVNVYTKYKYIPKKNTMIIMYSIKKVTQTPVNNNKKYITILN